jgi:hypothetical protein
MRALPRPFANPPAAEPEHWRFTAPALRADLGFSVSDSRCVLLINQAPDRYPSEPQSGTIIRLNGPSSIASFTDLFPRHFFRDLDGNA